MIMLDSSLDSNREGMGGDGLETGGVISGHSLVDGSASLSDGLTFYQLNCNKSKASMAVVGGGVCQECY